MAVQQTNGQGGSVSPYGDGSGNGNVQWNTETQSWGAPTNTATQQPNAAPTSAPQATAPVQNAQGLTSSLFQPGYLGAPATAGLVGSDSHGS